MRAETFDQNEFSAGLFDDLDEETNPRVSLEPQPHGGSLTRYGAVVSHINTEAHPAIDLWPPRLPMEIALCGTTEEEAAIVDRFHVTDYDYIQQLPEFRRAVSEAQVLVREGGYGFKVKCRGIAEDFLGTLDQNLYRVDVPLSQKLDIFKTVTRLGELEPKPKKDDNTGDNHSMVNIQINL